MESSSSQQVETEFDEATDMIDENEECSDQHHKSIGVLKNSMPSTSISMKNMSGRQSLITPIKDKKDKVRVNNEELLEKERKSQYLNSFMKTREGKQNLVKEIFLQDEKQTTGFRIGDLISSDDRYQFNKSRAIAQE